MPTILVNSRIIVYDATMPSIERVLQNLGLTDKEAAVYLALLPLGAAPASTISKRARLVRSTTQFTCNQLAQRGFLKATKKKNTYLYSCEPPQRILAMLDRQKDLLADQQEELRAVAGQLTGLMAGAASVPHIHFFEGKDGFVAAYQEMLEKASAGSETLSFMRPLDLSGEHADLSKSFTRLTALRKKKQIRARVLASHCPEAKAMAAQTLERLRETRVLHEDVFGPSSVEIMTCGDSVFIATIEGRALFACIMKNAPVAHMLGALFEMQWKREA